MADKCKSYSDDEWDKGEASDCGCKANRGDVKEKEKEQDGEAEVHSEEDEVEGGRDSDAKNYFSDMRKPLKKLHIITVATVCQLMS